MSSVHHKTAYEEVAVEQGENNKKQSSNTMVQSKFIYIAFAIVFTVILVQGIVLYFVLKPSSSTKQQSIFLDKIINSACKKSHESSKESSFNSSVNFFGITVDTSPIIRKIESALTNYDKSTFGRAIRFKPTDECLNGGLIANYSSGPYGYYKVFPAKCDGSPFQQWRKVLDVENNFHVGSAANYPKLGNSFTPCLDCHYGYKSCDLIVFPCNSYPMHYFNIRIFPNQIDFAQNRVYFTIHNPHYTQCLGRQYNEQYKVNVFYLQECTGNDDQSFYLEDLNFAEDVENIRIKISAALWPVLLGSEGKEQCPRNS